MLHAFYSATETAFACLNKYKFKVEADEGSRSARLIVWLYEHFESTLITVLIGNNVAGVAVSSVSTILFLKIFSSVMSEDLISILTSVLMAFVTFLFGDTIPKLVGKRAPNGVVRFTVYPIAFCYFLFYPLTLLFRGINAMFKKMFKAKPSPEITEDDFTSAVAEVEESGNLEENESDIIQATLDLDDTAVKDILTPLKKMAMIDASKCTQDDLIEFLKSTPYSRIPVYVKNPSKIIGVLVVKTYLAAFFKDPKINYLNYLQKPYFVTPSVKIDDLIEGFRVHRAQIALVRKDGRLLGMVTTEDALEELVGKIAEQGNSVATEEAQ